MACASSVFTTRWVGKITRPGYRTRPVSSSCSRRRVARMTVAGASKATIFERGLVAMVSVGNKYQRRLESALNDRDLFVSLDRAELIFDSEIIDHARAGSRIATSADERIDLHASPIEAENRTDIGVERGQQPRRSSLAAGKVFSCGEFCRALNSSRRTRAINPSRRSFFPPTSNCCVYEIDAGSRSELQNSVGAPFRKRGGGGAIAIRLATEFEPHHVVGVATVEFLLTFASIRS